MKTKLLVVNCLQNSIKAIRNSFQNTNNECRVDTSGDSTGRYGVFPTLSLTYTNLTKTELKSKNHVKKRTMPRP